jgi:hypothetical protein
MYPGKNASCLRPNERPLTGHEVGEFYNYRRLITPLAGVRLIPIGGSDPLTWASSPMPRPA